MPTQKQKTEETQNVKSVASVEKKKGEKSLKPATKYARGIDYAIKNQRQSSDIQNGCVNTEKNTPVNTEPGQRSQMSCVPVGLIGNLAKNVERKKSKPITQITVNRWWLYGFVAHTTEERTLSKYLASAFLFFLVFNIANASSVTYYEAPEKVHHVQRITPTPLPPVETLAVVSKILPHEKMIAEVSAYTSSADETDSTPNINAMGTKPGPGSIACPTRYAFGTKVIIGTDEFTCDDRMNPRYAGGDYFDIWVETKTEAMQWGRRTVKVTMLE